MANHVNSQDKQFYIYLNRGKDRIAVEESVYREYYRPIWATLKRQQEHGRCNCPSWRLCEGDCGMCRYHKAGDSWSLDHEHRAPDGEIISLHETLEDEDARFEDIVTDAMLLESLMNQLKQKYPRFYPAAQLMRDGKEDAEACAILGITKTTHSYQKLQAIQHLKELAGVAE